MKNGIMWGVGVIVAVIVIMVIARGGDSGEQPVIPTPDSVSESVIPPPTITTTTPVPPPTAVTVKEFTVTGSNFTFAPASMTVNKGDTVKLTFVNSEGVHDWRLDEFNAKTNVLRAVGQETITFVADKSGSFEYYCSVGTHRQMGMKGTLIVR